MKRWFFLFVVGGVVGWIIANPMVANGQSASGLNLTTSPLPINLVAEPGATVSAQLKIKNNGLETEIIHISLMKFDAYGEEGRPRLLDREKGDDYFDWISFSENDFDLDTNEWKTVEATINIPPEAAFGYYYAITFSRADDPVLTQNSTTKIVGATASLVLLEVRVPQAKREIEVLEFSTERRIYEFLPMAFNIKLKNKGNVHVAPRGNIFIEDGSGKEVAMLEINAYKGNVLPNTNRIFEADWADGFPVYKQREENKIIVTDKKGKPVKDLRWDFSTAQKFRWGKYKATMLLAYDDGSRDVPIEAGLTFYVVPWRILAVGLVVVVLLGAGLYATVGRLFLSLLKKKV